MRCKSIFVISFIMGVFFIFYPYKSVQAATINVACDSNALITAIQTANSTPQLDTLNLTEGCTYALTTVAEGSDNNATALPYITSPITINGNGAILRRTGSDKRILRVQSNGSAHLINLAIENGFLDTFGTLQGAGLFNAGHTQLTQVTVSGNLLEAISDPSQGGGIYNSGTMTITNSLIQGNTSQSDGATARARGGGIYNTGTLTLQNSTLDNNIADSSGNNANSYGGGVFNNNELTIHNSTFRNNGVTVFGITTARRGGGIYNTNGTISMIHVTFYNQTQHGIYNTGGSSSTSIINTVFSKGSGNNCVDAAGTLSGSSSLADDGSCTGIPNTAVLNINSTLENNGGPTPTLALNAGSPAIDTAASCPLVADQRGVSRPQNGSCDIGAYEVGGFIWDGGGVDNNWTTAANWSGDLVPSAADTAFFNQTSHKDVVIDSSVTIERIVMGNIYTGTMTIDQPLTVTDELHLFSGNIVLSNTLDIDGNLSMVGGMLDVGVGDHAINIGGSWLNWGGVFNGRQGTVTFDGTQTGQTIESNNSQPFYNVAINNSGEWEANNGLMVNNLLSIADGQLTIHSGELSDVQVGATGAFTGFGQLAVSQDFVNNGALNIEDATLLFDGAVIQNFHSGGATTLTGLEIGAGTTLGISHDLNLLGDFSNDGVFTPETHRLTFSGGITQNLTANTPTTIYDLTIISPTILVETVIADNITIDNELINNGIIRKIQPITSNGLYTFGLTGAQVNVTDQQSLNQLQIDRIDQSHPNATGLASNIATGKYWDITAIDTSNDWTVNLTLPYVAPDDMDKLCRYIGGVDSEWDCGYTSHTADSITRNDVTDFSDWAVEDTIDTLTIFRLYLPLIQAQ